MSKQEWIDVEKELPDEDVLMLLCAPEASEPVWPGYLNREDGYPRWYWADGTPVSHAVTHFQPFPELPESVR